MSLKPKIEFFTIQLKHKNDKVKTFKDFVIDELKGKEIDTNDVLYKKLFTHFMKALGSDVAKYDKLRKEIKLVNNKKNRFLDFKPSYKSEKNYISGVINGGFFGKDGILTGKETEHSINKDMSVLYYYYIFMYLPLDYKEGFIIVHSNSKEENITNIYKHFSERLFRGENYKISKANYFTPKVFQKEFLNHSYLSHLTFSQSMVDNYDSKKCVTTNVDKYNVRLIITPNTDEKIKLTDLKNLKNYFGKLIFGRTDKEIELSNFDRSSVTLKNSEDKSEKTFSWNVEKEDFVPVVYLKDRIKKFNADGTPNFKELDEYCIKLFENKVLKEFRPDLNVSKIK